jgi:hypothetical protein
VNIRRVVAAAFAFVVLFLSSQAFACSGATSVSPNNGPEAGGTTVTVTGSGFHCAVVTVKFGGNIGTSLNVINDSTLTVVTPAGSGTVDVTVTIDGTPYTIAAGYTYGTPAAPGPATDSNNARSMQIGMTKSVSTTSGQIISGAVDGAIGGAFSDTGGPVTVGSNGVSFNFAAEPRERNRTDEAFGALAYAAKAPMRSPVLLREWSAWADLRGTGYDNNSSVGATRGHQVNVTAGIGRRLSQDLLVGVFAGYEMSRSTIDALAGKLEGQGGSVGGYAAWRFAPHWRIDAMLGWTGLTYDATAATATGSFKGSRWIASGGLTGQYRAGSVMLEPAVRLTGLWERQTAWTDSLGAAQADRNFSVGRLSAGGKAIYPWQSGSTRLDPYLGLYADYRFSTDSALATNVTDTGLKDGTSGRVTAGLSAATPGGFTVSLGGELGGLGANYKVWTGSLRAGKAF